MRIVAGQGRLSDEIRGLAAHRVEVLDADGAVTEELEGDVVLIATGADPRVLPGAEPDGERILDWRDVYDLEEMPEHLVVVGSGVTGAEFASGYLEAGRAGHAGLLPRPGAAGGGLRRRRGARAGLPVPRRPDRRARPGRRRCGAPRRACVVELTDGRTVEGSHALMTVGTVPNTGGLNLEQCGRRGRRRPGTSSSTGSRAPRCPASTPPVTSPGVFQLASVAAMQGRIAMWHALGEAVAPIKLKTVAANVFTHPEIATVGVQEKSLSDDADVDVVRLPLATNARAKMSDLHDGFVKLFARRSTGVVVGGVVVAPGRLGARAADRARRHQGADGGRPGADVRDLPLAVRLDHRGRPAADGRPTTSPDAGAPAAPGAAAADVTADFGSTPPHRCRRARGPPMERGCLLSGAPSLAALLRSLAVGLALAAVAVARPGRLAAADGRPARPSSAGSAGLARGGRTDSAAAAAPLISWVQTAGRRRRARPDRRRRRRPGRARPCGSPSARRWPTPPGPTV